MRRPRWLSAGLAVALLAACSGSGDGDSGDDDRSSATTATGAATGEASTTAGSPTTAAPTTTTAAPDPYGDYESDVYSSDEHWLCRPGLADNVCVEGLDATVLEAGGGESVEPHVVAEEPSFDCFYVYPTVALGAEGNAPFDGDYGAEILATRNQAARFSRHCEVYAPLYRQRSLQATDPNAGEIAYADVLDAWKYYVAHDNNGRGVVLIGHSQGSSHLGRLVREEIDGRPELRDRLISALLVGWSVAVPEGADVGGDFAEVPACRAADQTGCVISYASFRSTSPPPANSIFGRPRRGGGVALCTNPAALEGGPAELDSYFQVAGEGLFATGSAAGVEVSTPFARLPGLVSGECVTRDGFSYLEITVRPDPADPRPDDIRGDLTPEWGLHLVDVNLTLGNLLDLVEQQAAAWLAGRGG